MNEDIQALRLSIVEFKDAVKADHEAIRAEISEFRKAAQVHNDSLHANIAELVEQSQKQSRRIDDHTEQLKIDAEHIRALARIAEIHDRRLSGLEGHE